MLAHSFINAKPPVPAHHKMPINSKQLKSSKRRLNNLVVILAAVRIHHPLGPIPQHDAAHIGHVGRRGALDGRRHGARIEISRAGAGRAGGGPDVELGPSGDVFAPGGEAVDEAGLANVAVAVVLELDPLRDTGLVHCILKTKFWAL